MTTPIAPALLSAPGQIDENRALRKYAALLDSLLAELPGPAALPQLGQRLLAAVGSDQGAIVASVPVKPACAAGCSACCSLQASAFVHELIAIWLWLQETRTPAELEQQRERVERAAAHRRQHVDSTAAAVRLLPCPLLDARGGCGVHAVRPLVCAGGHSLDAGDCSRWNAAVGTGASGIALKQLKGLRQLSQATLQATAAVLRARGLDAGRYELTQGLADLWADPDRIERWARGEKVFEHRDYGVAATGTPPAIPSKPA